MSSHVSDPTETAESARFERAIVRFDAAHAADPDHETVDGREQPKELVYASRTKRRKSCDWRRVANTSNGGRFHAANTQWTASAACSGASG
jgi:hypothetical protein